MKQPHENETQQQQPQEPQPREGGPNIEYFIL